MLENIPIENQDYVFLAWTIIVFILGWIGRYYAYIYANSKTKIRQFRKLLDNVDDALYDDKVTEQEFRDTYEAAKELLKK